MPREESEAGGEWFSHRTRKDGARDLSFGDLAGPARGHVVMDKNGNVKYAREKDGRVICDDAQDGQDG
jgi:hypothetical protein